MQQFPKPRPTIQLQLFHRTPGGLHWVQLPREIRQQSVKLLARLLGEHWARRHRVQRAEEARDE